MPAYLLGEITVKDADTYRGYSAKVDAVLAKFGGKFLVRGGATQSLEGAPFSRIVVIEFPTMDAAKRFYNAPEYQTILAIRLAASDGRLTLVEGFAPA
jgi:uncharacterized protein (DUF1330 family)